MPSTLMRDSSADYRTYWLQDGQYYSKMRNLGDSAACALPADKLAQIPELDRKLILDEVASNPELCRKLYQTMAKDRNWHHNIAASMASAVANALDPKVGAAGPWRKLQETVRTVVDSSIASIDQAVASMTLGKKIEIAQAIAARGKPRLSGLGQFEAIGSLFTGISDYFGSKVLASAQKDIAKTNANAAIDVANAQMSIAQANAAIAAAQVAISNPISSAMSTLTSTTIAGVPILVPILGLVGVGLWFAFGRK